MRHAAILDVLRAVKELADDHPEVSAWWYAPALRLRLRGQRPRSGKPLSLEIVVEPATAVAVNCHALASELGRRLPGDLVAVRLHRGPGEVRRLFRLKSREALGAEDSRQATS